MADYNLVVLVGRLTHDPELHHDADSGAARTCLTLCVRDRTSDPDGGVEVGAAFIDVLVQRQQAEFCCQYLRKGSSMLVSGLLERVDGRGARDARRTHLRVRAQRIQFLGSRTSLTDVANDGSTWSSR